MAFATSTSTSTTFLFFLLLLPFSAVGQADDGRVEVGSSLITTKDGSPWVSPSGDFAFGFHPHADRFLVSIWFDKVPSQPLVWYAFDDGNPILAPAGSKIELTAENGLVLRDPRGQQLWRSDIATDEAAYGVMNDTGNFVVRSRNSNVLWQSFDHPTDTLLPTQTLEINGKLFSRLNENNFSQGRFQLSFQNDGNLVLNMVNLPTKFVYQDGPFYTSNTANESNSGVRLIFNESGQVYVLTKNGLRSHVETGARATLPTPATDFYHRVTLDFDGIFSHYYYPKGNTSTSVGNWSTVWSQPENICNRMGERGSGACGYNSICRLNDSGRPTCSCPPGFSLLDPDDKYGSCKSDVELDCREDGRVAMEDLYDTTVLLNTDWPGAINDYDLLQPHDEQDCRAACLRDCMCAVAILKDDSCWKKKLPLTNGREDGGFSGKAFIKFTKRNRTIPSLNLPNVDEENNKGTLITISTLLGTSMFVNFALVGAFCLGFLSIYQKKLPKVEQVGLETNLQVFTHEELAEATNGFKEELGRGAFGIVYKGTIGMSTVAVKKLDRAVRDGNWDKEFKTEINVIGQTHHKNLVRLLGFCQEKDQRLLVYEFLCNGTLADYLFRNAKPSWNQRTQIAKSIASGLLYLHEECSTQIIHCDIKPENILLDHNYNARISDFGLSKLLMMDQTQTKTGIRGTKGYVAPEWFRNMPVTAKVDVYSFGVLLLEIICCRRSVVVEETAGCTDRDSSILTYWAYDCFQEGTIDDLIGDDDMEARHDRKCLERFLMTALWCIQEDPCLRPTMRKVTQMLEGVVQVTIPPNPSPFTITVG